MVGKMGVSVAAEQSTAIVRARCVTLEGTAFGVQTGLGQVDSLPPGAADAPAESGSTPPALVSISDKLPPGPASEVSSILCSLRMPQAWYTQNTHNAVMLL